MFIHWMVKLRKRLRPTTNIPRYAAYYLGLVLLALDPLIGDWPLQRKELCELESRINRKCYHDNTIINQTTSK